MESDPFGYITLLCALVLPLLGALAIDERDGPSRYGRAALVVFQIALVAALAAGLRGHWLAFRSASMAAADRKTMLIAAGISLVVHNHLLLGALLPGLAVLASRSGVFRRHAVTLGMALIPIVGVAAEQLGLFQAIAHASREHKFALMSQGQLEIAGYRSGGLAVVALCVIALLWPARTERGRSALPWLVLTPLLLPALLLFDASAIMAILAGVLV